MSDDAIMSVSNLRVSVAGDEGMAKILDHIDFRVGRGRIHGIVGESGCGKTTLIRTILGILPESAQVESGEISFADHNLLQLSERDLNRLIRGVRIGFIPQDPYLALNPLFRVGQQLLEITRRCAMPSDMSRREWKAARRRKLVDVIRRVGLGDPEVMLERYPHQFSGGQRQRLLIAGALAASPSLIIADEPTTALDVTTQKQILELLRELVQETGISLLFITHDLGVVAQLCDDLSVIYAGQLVESGPTRKLLSEPHHPYMRALLACHPDRATGFLGIPGRVPSPVSPPSGCRFAPRCPEAMSGCTRRAARLIKLTPDRRVDCLRYES